MVKPVTVERRALLDSLSVQRWHLRNVPHVSASPEYLSREPRFKKMREEVSMAERIDAWRRILKNAHEAARGATTS